MAQDYKMTLEEMETIITFNRATDECTIYTCDRTVMTKCDKLYECIEDKGYSKTYQTTKDMISFRSRKRSQNYTEEQKEKLRKQLAKARQKPAS